MYTDHFGLSEKPFTMADLAAFYFAAPQQQALDILLYAIEQNQGPCLVTGPPGLGKSTLLLRIQRELRNQTRVILLSDLAASGGPLLLQLAAALGLRVEQNLPVVLANYLESEAERGTRLALLVDEAQSLTKNQLSELRLLSNLQIPGERLVDLILCGQPELRRVMNDPQNEALSQRMTIRVRLEPLTLEQAQEYIHFRLRTAGGHEDLFDASAVGAIDEASRGVPRLINLIAEHAMIAAYADGESVVTEANVADALKELDLTEPLASRLEATFSDSDPEPQAELDNRLRRIESKLDRLLEMNQNLRSREDSN